MSRNSGPGKFGRSGNIGYGPHKKTDIIPVPDPKAKARRDARVASRGATPPPIQNRHRHNHLVSWGVPITLLGIGAVIMYEVSQHGHNSQGDAIPTPEPSASKNVPVTTAEGCAITVRKPHHGVADTVWKELRRVGLPQTIPQHRVNDHLWTTPGPNGLQVQIDLGPHHKPNDVPDINLVNPLDKLRFAPVAAADCRRANGHPLGQITIYYAR